MNGIDDLPAPWSIEEVHSYSFEIRYKNEVLDTRKTYNNAMVRAKRMIKAQVIPIRLRR